MDVLERFESKVEMIPDGCHVWMGSTTQNGYGVFAQGYKKSVLAHRFVYTLHRGIIPKGQVVMHSCDNPSCVNPQHLSLGTYKANMADMKTKRRGIFAEQHPNSKLTNEQVSAIRSKYIFRVYTQIDLAHEYEVSLATIQKIIQRRSWAQF